MRSASKPVRTATRLLVTSTVGAASLGALSPGQAYAKSTTCKETSKTFEIPGADPNRKATVRLCTDRSTDGAYVRGCGKITFSSLWNIAKAFDYFGITMDVRNKSTGARLAGSTWDHTNLSNGSANVETSWFCTAWAHVGGSAPRVYHNTGTVTYNIDGDGLGRFTWKLNPTEVI